MAKTQKKTISLLIIFCLCLAFFGLGYSKTAEANGEINKLYYAEYGTFVSSYSTSTVYNNREEFQINGGTSEGRYAFLQFDLTEFLSSDEPVNKAEMVLFLSQQSTNTQITVRYLTNDVWNASAERKDAFGWGGGIRSAIVGTNVSSLQERYDITDAGIGPVRLDITNAILYTLENYGNEVQGYPIDYVVSFQIYASSGSGSTYFYSQNAPEAYKPYIEFNNIPAVPAYDISLDITGNGGVYSSRELVEEDGVKKYIVQEGENITLKIVPDAGYEIASLKIDGEDALNLLEDYQIRLTNITADAAIEVVFEESADANIIYPIEDVTLSANDEAQIDKSELRVKTAGSLGSTTRLSYLKFDITDYDVNKGALLNLATFSNQSFTSGQVMVTAWGVNFTDWDETDWENKTKTWQDMPITQNLSLDGSINITGATKINQTPFVISKGSNWYAFNISDYLRAQKAVGMNTVTIILTGTYTSEPYIIFGSKENTEVLNGKLARPYISIGDIEYAVSVDEGENGQVSVKLPDGTATDKVGEYGTVIAEFTHDEGYVLRSVTVNGADMTEEVLNGKLYINNINQDVEIETVFAAARTITFDCPDTVRIYDAGFNLVQDAYVIAQGENVTFYFVLDAGYKMTLLENGLEAAGFAKNKITLTVVDDIEFEIQTELIG
jgi:hypothetical protein